MKKEEETDGEDSNTYDCQGWEVVLGKGSLQPAFLNNTISSFGQSAECTADVECEIVRLCWK